MVFCVDRAQDYRAPVFTASCKRPRRLVHSMPYAQTMVTSTVSENAVLQLHGCSHLSIGAFTCCDLPYQYVDEYYEVLGASYFPSILNHELLKVDRYPYHMDWELTAAQAFIKMFPAHSLPTPVPSASSDSGESDTPSKAVSIIDLRKPADFKAACVPGSINVDIGLDGQQLSNPFHDAEAMVKQWTTLNNLFSEPSKFELEGKAVVVLCYDGSTSRVATSVLRHYRVEAFSCVDGIELCLELSRRCVGIN